MGRCSSTSGRDVGRTEPVSGRRSGRSFAHVPGLLGLLLLVMPALGLAQKAQVESLAVRSSIVVRGRVLRVHASNDPMVAASSRTAVIAVRRMYAGREIAGDQSGRTATVILGRPETIKPGQEMLVFGSVRLLGASMTISATDVVLVRGAALALDTAVTRGAQTRQDQPLLERLASASLVFRGSVDSVRPLEVAPEQRRRPRTPPSEHDPEWQVATVRITTPLRRGEAGQTVTVVFAASRDVAWFNAPKLTPGQEAVFLAQARSSQDSALYRATGLSPLLERPQVYLVIAPYDVLAPTQEARVRDLLSKVKEE